MFRNTLMVCVCLGSLYAVEDDSATTPNSHLSFIFKEKQKENALVRPKWDFLSELTEEEMAPFSLLEPSLLGATGPASPTPNAPLSLRAPNLSTSASIQKAYGTIVLVKSHQNLLSTQQNNSGTNRIAFGRKELDESLYLVQNTSLPEKNQFPAGQTSSLGRGKKKNDFWIDVFGEKIKSSPAPDTNYIHNSSLGFLVGCDRFMSSGILSGAVGYAYTKISEDGHQGQGNDNQLLGLFQGTAYLPKQMYLGYGLYGSVNFNDFRRFINPGTLVAKSEFTSYTLTPNIDFGYDWSVNPWFIVEPLVSNNFFFNFQPSFSESGAPGYNQHQNASNSGLYILEPAVNLYERIERDWGLLVLRQKFGYERAQPMFGTENTTSIIDVQENISIPIGLRDLNLFVFEFELFSRASGRLYGDLFYRGSFGSGLISNMLRIKIGYFF